MGLFSSMRISGSALTAQRLRMDVIAGNIANADTTRINGQRAPYQRQQVVFQPLAQGGSPAEGLQVAAIVKDRIWHASQQLKDRTDGSVTMTLEVSDDYALRNWILGFGRYVRVVAPASLVDWATHTTSYQYFPDGSVKQTSNANTTTATDSYDNAARLFPR